MSEYAVFCGLDVGKEAHHACALDPDGRRLFDAVVPQEETRLRELLSQLSEHGKVLVVVHQSNTIGALPIAVARAMGIDVAYLPGLAMRRTADLHPGRRRPGDAAPLPGRHRTRGGPSTRPAPPP